MTTTFRESDVRKWIRKTWKHGIHFIEYAQGGDAGNPDCHLVQRRRLVPCELKVATYTNGRYAFKLRRAQYDYHKECYDYGIPTIFVIGFQRTYVCAAGPSIEYADKMGIVASSKCREVTHHDDLAEAIDDAVKIANQLRLVG